MRNTFLCFVFFLFSLQLFAQKENYDIVSYTSPAKFKKESSNFAVIYSKKDSGSWCQLIIYKSVASKGNIEDDMQSEWESIVSSQHTIISNDEKTKPETNANWYVMSHSGTWQYNGSNVASILTTFCNKKVCVSILCNTTAQPYLKDFENLIASIELNSDNIISDDVSNNNNITGTWIKSGSVNPVYGNTASWNAGGYTKDEYIFYANGTYKFYSKSFGYMISELIFVRESGTYEISGNNLTISPVKSIIESYNKKNGTDKWGDLVQSKERALEKTTYTFTKYFFTGIKEWNLVLQSSTKTNRDGAFGTNPTFKNAYYYTPITKNHTAIEIP